MYEIDDSPPSAQRKTHLNNAAVASLLSNISDSQAFFTPTSSNQQIVPSKIKVLQKPFSKPIIPVSHSQGQKYVKTELPHHAKPQNSKPNLSKMEDVWKDFSIITEWVVIFFFFKI